MNEVCGYFRKEKCANPRPGATPLRHQPYGRARNAEAALGRERTNVSSACSAALGRSARQGI